MPGGREQISAQHSLTFPESSFVLPVPARSLHIPPALPLSPCLLPPVAPRRRYLRPSGPLLLPTRSDTCWPPRAQAGPPGSGFGDAASLVLRCGDTAGDKVAGPWDSGRQRPGGGQKLEGLGLRMRLL